jgi:acetyl-CoA carboxylase biotin carboxyl carrier protein
VVEPAPGAVRGTRRTDGWMTEDVIASRARALASALAESGFARLRVRDGETEIELRRAPRAAPAAAAAALPQLDGAVAEGNGVVERGPDLIASDVVGVVRHLRPPIAEGQELDADRDLAYVETLGIRNPVRSRGSGKILEVLVTDGQPVEYGQPLFAIQRP